MSVPEPLRHKGRLAAHTALILKNPKVFDPEVDVELINRIRNCAYDIYAKAWAANKINAEGNTINRAMRYQLQEEAILTCDAMHAYIGIAKAVFHLKKRKMAYWSRMILETRALLQAWKESDVKRYGQP